MTRNKNTKVTEKKGGWGIKNLLGLGGATEKAKNGLDPILNEKLQTRFNESKKVLLHFKHKDTRNTHQDMLNLSRQVDLWIKLCWENFDNDLGERIKSELTDSISQRRKFEDGTVDPKYYPNKKKNTLWWHLYHIREALIGYYVNQDPEFVSSLHPEWVGKFADLPNVSTTMHGKSVASIYQDILENQVAKFKCNWGIETSAEEKFDPNSSINKLERESQFNDLTRMSELSKLNELNRLSELTKLNELSSKVNSKLGEISLEVLKEKGKIDRHVYHAYKEVYHLNLTQIAQVKTEGSARWPVRINMNPTRSRSGSNSSDHSSSEEKVKSLKNRIGELEREIKHLKENEDTVIDTKGKSPENTVEETVYEIDEKGKITPRNAREKELLDQVAQYQIDINNLLDDNQEYANELGIKMGELSDAKAELADLQAELDNQEVVNDNLVKTVNQKEQTIDDLCEEIDNAQKELSELEEVAKNYYQHAEETKRNLGQQIITNQVENQTQLDNQIRELENQMEVKDGYILNLFVSN